MKALNKRGNGNKFPRRYSLKFIKGKMYVYRWEYIRKAERNNSQKRYRWIYVGPWNGKGREYIKSLSLGEYELAMKEELYERLRMGQIKKLMLSISSQQPFLDKRLKIESLSERNKRGALIDELQRDITRVATEKVDAMLSQFTIDTFYEFIKSGGDITKLDID
ncbi:hypothetical protein FOA22_03285 [Heyndrickxia oleronia]|uniref:hypothetical protein n=1 Tax=Heyndrickxia oleronia TaxID=38875 RepID=UPI0007174CD7